MQVIVLAAGRSSRMGEPKGLVAFEGRPWLLAQLEAIALGIVGKPRRAVVVLGADRERYLDAIPELGARARLAFNDDPDRGSFSSLQCGLAAAEPDAPVFVLPIDVPAAVPHVWIALYRALTDADASAPSTTSTTSTTSTIKPSGIIGPDAAVPVFEGRGGHPVGLAATAVTHLLGRPVDSRLDAELSRLRVARVAVDDPRVRLNLNAPQDWVKLQARH